MEMGDQMAQLKYIRVTMPDNSRWDILAAIIADNRAKYYQSDGYDEEYAYAMNNDDELFDWAAGNMNWEDVKEFAVKVPEVPSVSVDYQDGWINGKKEIVLKDK
jgi:hypothetical protein